MTNRQVLMTAILVIAISMSIAGTEDVFASHGGGPDDHSCSNNVDPEITGITPTIDGAILEWIQDPTRTGRGGHHICDTDIDEFQIETSGNPSFSSTVSGTTFTETITGLECGEEYEVDLTTDWDKRGQRDTSTSGEFETLACEVIPDCSEDFGYNEETNQCIPFATCDQDEFLDTETNTCESEEEEEPQQEGDCSWRYEDPVITSIVPTIDGAEITWIQDQKRFFFWCFDPQGFTVTSGSFEEEYDGGTSGEATITGLECGTNYEVEVETDWVFHSDTTDSDEYTTLACDVEEEDERGGGGDDRHKTSPTSGNDWNTLESIVEGGITVDGETFTIVDNWYTPFDQIQIETGSTHSFGVKTFAQNGGIMVQEIAFGITAIGDYANAEALVEVHYDWDKTILEVIVVQDTEVIDVSTLNVSTDQVQCRSDADAICYQTDFDLKFNEPLKDKVYAVKAFDMTRRTMMPHYFNDGISVFGDSLNPMLTMQIASTERYEGLITITQIEKYSNLWVTEDGRIFDSDNLYTQTNKVIQKGYNDARGSPVQQMNADGQAYLASQLYFDSSKIQGTDGGFIASIVDTDGDSREKTLQQLVSYNNAN